MHTPTKDSSIRFVSSNFEPTNSKKTPNTLDTKVTPRSLDLLNTPKQTTFFYPYPDRPLRIHQFKNIRNNRARLLDWYLQIFQSYQLSWDCFWFAVELLDTLIADFNYITLQNVHIAGIVCFFIAAKMQGRNKLGLKHVIVGVGHNKFSKEQILEEEGRIVNLVLQDSNFQRVTIYSYLMEKYSNITSSFLSRAMEMLVLASMRPEIAYERLRVSTYRQLVDSIMIELSANKTIPILQSIRAQIKTSFGNQNVSRYCKQISL